MLHNYCDDFIDEIAKKLPENCTVNDLVDIGLFRSVQAAAHARRTKKSPDYFKLPNRAIIYPKEGVISFLNESKHKGMRKR